MKWWAKTALSVSGLALAGAGAVALVGELIGAML